MNLTFVSTIGNSQLIICYKSKLIDLNKTKLYHHNTPTDFSHIVDLKVIQLNQCNTFPELSHITDLNNVKT